jgi:hypothetical protein
MNLKKVLPSDVEKLMKGKEFWIEEKLDGVRLFLHYQEGQFKYFSRYISVKSIFFHYLRNAFDRTNDFGATKDEKFSAEVYPLLTKQSVQS